MSIGYIGKLPAFGDFIDGGAAHGARRGWYGWAERGLAQTRHDAAGSFEDIFLTAPIWRFVVGGGNFSDNAVFGLLCPSMDTVGRLFPFSFLGEATHGVDPLSAAISLGSWFDDMETVMLDALDPAFTRGALDGGLRPAPGLHRAQGTPTAPTAPTTFRMLELDEDGTPRLQAADGLDLSDTAERAADGIWMRGPDAQGRKLAFEQFGRADDRLFTLLVMQEFDA